MKAFSVFGLHRTHSAEAVKLTASAYYLRLARRIKFVKYAFALLVVLITLYAFTVNRTQMTISNLRYMLKYIEFATPENTTDRSDIIFDHDEKSSFALLRDNVVVADNTGLSVYDANGQHTLNASVSFSFPAVTTSDKFVYAYDLGGGTNNLTISNTYSVLYSYQYVNPIYGVSVNGDGAFCVITADKGYTSGLKVYDSNNRVIYSKQYGDRHTVSVSLNEDASRLLVVTVETDDGDYSCEVYRYNTKFEDEVNTLRFLGEMPLKIQYTDSGFVFLTDKALRFYTGDCELLKEIYFGDQSVKRFFFSDEYVIMTYATQVVGNSTKTSVYDTAGNELKVLYFEGDVLGCAKYGDSVYTLTSGKLTIQNIVTDEEETRDVSTSYSNLVAGQQYVAVSCESGATVFAITTASAE